MSAPSSPDQMRPRPLTSNEDVVERAESYVRAHLAGPIPISLLCQVVGRSERGLRNAFYDVRGMSPKRCLVADRLQRVRQTLGDDRSGRLSVTHVATSYGFYELGRFAAMYRKAFGEAPSETLRAAMRKSSRMSQVSD